MVAIVQDRRGLNVSQMLCVMKVYEVTEKVIGDLSPNPSSVSQEQITP